MVPEATVEGWLKQLSLERYLPLFVENQVEAKDLNLLNDTFLKEIGVKSVKHRNQILAAPKPIIKNKDKSKSDAGTGKQIKVLWLYFLAPFCAGLCCFIAEVCFVAVGLPTMQNAKLFGATSTLGAFTVFFCLLRTQHNLLVQRTVKQDIVSVLAMLTIYALVVFVGLQSLDLDAKTNTEMLISWIIFVGIPVILLRKLLFKNLAKLLGLAFALCLISVTWEILLMGYLNDFDFTGLPQEQQKAWAITLLIFIRSLSVFLFYTRAALDIRHLVTNQPE